MPGGASPFAALWPNAAGSAVMGAYAAAAHAAPAHHAPAVAAAVATGFCGTLTTFAGWMGDAAGAALCADGRTAWQSTVAWATVLLVGTAVPLGALVAGTHAGEWLWPRRDGGSGEVEKEMVENAASAADLGQPPRASPASAFAVAACVAAVVFGVAAAKDDRDMLATALLAPFGAFARMLLGRALNGRKQSRDGDGGAAWPLGTLAANTLGTVLLVALLVPEDDGGVTDSFQSPLLFGLRTGMCGALSTVSSMALETGVALPRAAAYKYFAASVIVGQTIALAVLGFATDGCVA